ncbi:MAG: class I SAM-dependent methyltransferase [Clostridiales bacterium]|nr:class I SAM-dependent methyltransferase [Clostridiales bacterium]
MPSYSSFASFYDRLTQNVGYEQRAREYIEILAQNGINSGILLDLACGTGSFTEHFCRSGFDVIGVDASPEMLCEAQAKLSSQEPPPLLLCQLMQNLDLYGTVDAAVCALDSINHLPSLSDVRKTFSRLSLFVRPGGIFIFDANTIYKHREILGNNTFVYDLDDIYCVWQNTLLDDTVSVGIDIDIFARESGQKYARYCEAFTETAYTPEELECALCDNGFEVLSICGENTRSAPVEDTQRMIITAKHKT